MINNTNTFRIQIEFSRKITLVKVTRNEKYVSAYCPAFFQSPTLPRLSLALQGEVNHPMAKIQNLAHGTVPHLYLKKCLRSTGTNKLCFSCLLTLGGNSEPVAAEQFSR